MAIKLNRLDPRVPDPVESRRQAAGRFVRIAYATVLFGILAFFVGYFGAPLVLLSGPGIVTSTRHVISAPYTVQISRIDVSPGETVQRGEVMGEVLSPEMDNIGGNYMRALAEIASHKADLRVKARVAQDTLNAARAYLSLAEEGVKRLEGSSAGTLSYRLGIYREHALANKAVVSQQAEVDESISQLADLDDISQQLRERLNTAEQHFARGQIVAPISGVVSTSLARAGQSVVAGTPIAEILDTSEVFVDWYVPNDRLADPKVGNQVLVKFGNRRLAGTIVEILPLSAVYGGAQSPFGHDRSSTQIARVRFNSAAQTLPLNVNVDVHMYYTAAAARLANWLAWLFGFG